MSRRRPKKEDWGGEGGSDDEGTNDQPASNVGLDELMKRNSSKHSKLAFKKGEGDGDDGGGGNRSSDDEHDSGDESDSEQQAATSEETRNNRERARENEDQARRDHEAIHSRRAQQEQGIELDREEEDEYQVKQLKFNAKKQTEEQKAARKAKAMHSATEQTGDQKMDESEGGAEADTEMTAEEEEAKAYRELQAKIRETFDKKKDDRYMTFHADDPLRPNPNKARAAAREDEELEDDNNDPWLKQAAEDAARAAARAEADGIDFDPATAASSAASKQSLRSSTEIFNDDSTAMFDTHAARETLLKHMQPGETVLRAVKRLGTKPTGAVSNGASASAAAQHKPATKMKNVRTKPSASAAAASTPAAAASSIPAEDPSVTRARKLAFDEVTEAAQGFISSGTPEIYQDSYEKIAQLVENERTRRRQAEEFQRARAAAAASSSAPSAPRVTQDARARAAARLQRKRDARAAGLPEPDSSDDDDDDMPAATSSAAAASSRAFPPPPAAAPAASSSSSTSDVQWMYRWSSDDTTSNGPISGVKLAEMRSSGLLDANVQVQRFNPQQAQHQQQQWIGIGSVDLETGQATEQESTHAQEPPKKRVKF